METQRKGQFSTTSLINKLDKKPYRDAFVRANISHGVAYQIKTIRKSKGISQYELARKIGASSQSIISRLEDPSYGKISITTLEKIASAFDLALIVKFSSFSEFTREISKTLYNNPYSYDEEKFIGRGSHDHNYIVENRNFIAEKTAEYVVLKEEQKCVNFCLPY